VLFVPFAVWHVIRYFTRNTSAVRLIVPIAYLVASATQLVVWAYATKNPNVEPTLRTFVPDVTKLYSTKVATELLFGVRASEHLWDIVGYGLAAFSVGLLVVLLGWKFWRSTTTSRIFIAACVLASGAIYVVSLWQRADFIDSMVARNGTTLNFLGMRYELFPAALLVLALLVRRDLRPGAIAEAAWGPAPPLTSDVRRERGVLAVAVVWLLVAFVPSYRLTTLRSPGPDWVAEVSDAERACAVDGSATEVIGISPAPDWVVAVPCSKLDG
jgi:hypothetical protein